MILFFLLLPFLPFLKLSFYLFFTSFTSSLTILPISLPPPTPKTKQSLREGREKKEKRENLVISSSKLQCGTVSHTANPLPTDVYMQLFIMKIHWFGLRPWSLLCHQLWALTGTLPRHPVAVLCHGAITALGPRDQPLHPPPLCSRRSLMSGYWGETMRNPGSGPG